MSDDHTIESTDLRARDESAEATYSIGVVGRAASESPWVVGGAGPARALLGTSPASDFRLEGRQVSRRHVAFELSGASLVVTDLGSTNGTWIAGVRIREAELRGGEHLNVGEHTLLVQRGAVGRAELAPEGRFGRMLGASREMRRLYPLFTRLAATSVPVLIQGEAGTGKELLAESLHREGPRKEAPFVVLEGAGQGLENALKQATSGTLVLDEVAELAPTAQRALVDALARGDVRFIAITRRDLDREVQAGRFRDDLFHRLAIARVELPPLRKRAADIPMLVEHFAAESGGDVDAIPAAVKDAWREAPWPSNVRELQNQVTRQIALGELAALSFAPSSGGPAPGAGTSHPGPGASDWLDPILAEKLTLVEARDRVNAVFERRYLEFMLADSGNNVVRAAARAGVARRYFQILKAKRLT